MSLLLPILLFGVLFWFLMGRVGGGSSVMSFSKSRAKKFTKDKPEVRFSDVAGVDEALAELEEVREFLAEPEKFTRLGAKIPKGVLLYGPPGTGKTLLAKAVAGEAGVPFYSISGSDFVEMFVGVGASRVRDLFKEAKSDPAAIVFVDEIDAVGRRRGVGMGGGNDEREQTLTSCWLRWTASTATRTSSSLRQRTDPTFWTRHCCVPAVLTVRLVWTPPTCRAANTSCACTPQASQSLTPLTWLRSLSAPPASPVLTWRTS